MSRETPQSLNLEVLPLLFFNCVSSESKDLRPFSFALSIWSLAMVSKAEAGICEFGPEPGSTIMWFGTMHQGKRFDQLPVDYRRWLVRRSKEKKSTNVRTLIVHSKEVLG